eukprot:SM000030S11385  [mRNA]  locus=s30:436968:440921:+ [translate_table: standard]
MEARHERRLGAIGRHMSGASPREELLARAEAAGVRVHPAVRAALAAHRPVVALESTIICHGMPYPQNLETALAVEETVRQNGATPATIAILNGTLHIGLAPPDLQRLAALGKAAKKVARRDIAPTVAKRENGATTVSATMFFAAKVGIRVFVTGGIGGVHRMGESTMDISSDLTELGRTPVAVVCAGAKSVLDIPRTLEYLETQGVTVVAYGANEFPAFFTRSSGCPAPCRVDTPEECAQLIEANARLDLQSGMVIGAPVPEQHTQAAAQVQDAIQSALKEAEGHIAGSEMTPFLLQRINEMTGGASLKINIHLLVVTTLHSCAWSYARHPQPLWLHAQLL